MTVPLPANLQHRVHDAWRKLSSALVGTIHRYNRMKADLNKLTLEESFAEQEMQLLHSAEKNGGSSPFITVAKASAVARLQTLADAGEALRRMELAECRSVPISELRSLLLEIAEHRAAHLASNGPATLGGLECLIEFLRDPANTERNLATDYATLEILGNALGGAVQILPEKAVTAS